MEFKEYHSIENSYRKKFMDKIGEEGYAGKTYVVQEKIHGGNFSFWITKDEIRCAKRTAFIEDDENFFNYEKVYDKYESKLKDLFKYYSKQGVVNVTVYGELYGGSYPHSDVKRVDVKAVQKGVYYNPDQDFIAFDLQLDGKYVTVDHANETFEKFGIPYSKTLFKGSLEECLKYSNEFTTTIPAIHGLPEIENNICEGVVIRPVEPLFFWSRERLIIKNKNDKFKEDSGIFNNKKPIKEVKKLEPHVLEAVEKANIYINESRLRNVLSKIGEVTNKDFGKIMGLFTKDVIEDFLKYNEEFQEFSKSDRKTVTKTVGQNAALLLRQNFMNIIDGEF